MATPLQLESALVLTLQDTIKWESAVQTEPPYINPALPVDPNNYQLRDRALAFRDLIVGAAVIEAAIQVSDVYNYSTDYPLLQGAVFPKLSFYGSNTGQVTSQVRHVTNASIPWDAARYADCDLYGRDALVYEVLARACEQAFIENPVPRIDLTGTLIPATSTWSLGEALASRADINPALPLDMKLFKAPDQNLADRDNQLAGYVAQMVQKLKNPFAYALRLYVQVLTNGKVDREPDIYALISDDGIDRVFQTEPALAGANIIVYNISHQTLQWVREHVDEIHVPQIYALMIPGIVAQQSLQTLPTVPNLKDAQYWRSKAGQIVPNGESITDISSLPHTYSSGVAGGVLQTTSASLTVPGALVATLPAISSGLNRVNVLINPCPVVDVSGSQNSSNTGGTNGGADWAINVASGDIGSFTYFVQGGNGIVYNGVNYLPGTTFAGDPAFPTYTQLGADASAVRQATVTWNLALPPGTWSLQIEYADLTGTNTGMGLRADYIVSGVNPVSIAKDIVPLTTSGPAGTLNLSQRNFFNVVSAQAFALTLNWTYGNGQLQVRRLIFATTVADTVELVLNAQLGSAESVASFTAVPNQPEVVRFDFPSTGNSTTLILSASTLDVPVRVEAIDVQQVGSFSSTSLSAGFQGWRQECLDRAERVIQQGYNQTLYEFRNAGSVIPTFRDSGSNWSSEATESWMGFIEVANPRLREIASVGSLCTGRQYQAGTNTVYNGTTYLSGDKFYGVDGVVGVNHFVTQIGAFVKSKPGHLGRPCLVPRGLYYGQAATITVSGTANGVATFTSGTAAKANSTGTLSAKAYWDTPFSSPTIVACQPWMIENGLYVAQPDFWMPDMLGADLPIEILEKAPPMPGQIQVTPNPLNLPVSQPSSSSFASFDVTNVGGTAFSGTATLSAGDFAVSGSNAYALSTSQHMSMLVQYTPTTPGISDGTTSWSSSAVATFTGGGGAFVPIFGTAVLGICPVYSPLTITWSDAGGTTRWALVWHKPTRKLFVHGSGGGFWSRISTATDSYFDLVNNDAYLINTAMNWDSSHDVLFAIDQAGRFIWVNPYTGALTGGLTTYVQTDVSVSTPSPRRVAFDSDNRVMVFSEPIFPSGTSGKIGIASFSSPSTWTTKTGYTWSTNGKCAYNTALKKVIFANLITGTNPYWYFDTNTFSLTPSSLTIGPINNGSIAYVPELNVVVMNISDTNTLYVIDGTTEAIMWSGAAVGTFDGGAAFNPCKGTGMGMLYVATYGSPTVHTFDPAAGYAHAIITTAQPLHDIIMDPWSGAIYGVVHSSETILKI